MKHEIRKVTHYMFMEWARTKEHIDIEYRYVFKLTDLLKDYGYDKYVLGLPTKGLVGFSHFGVRIFSMEYNSELERKSLGKPNYIEKALCIDVHQYDDYWFVLKIWEDYQMPYEERHIYICDQFESVIYCLEKFMEKYPKTHINESIGESDYVKINGYNRSFHEQAARLGGMIQKEYFSTKTLSMIYGLFKTNRITIYEGTTISIGLRYGDISIHSFNDEWFLVGKGDESNSHYDWWKCDQDDQLKMLLLTIKNT
jgi:hypothetical protein